MRRAALAINERESKRRQQCVYRGEKSQCLLVNLELGWNHATLLDQCDRCYEKGPETPEAEAYRKQLVEEQLRFRTKNIAAQPKPVVVALTVKHMSPEERQKTLARKDVQNSLKAEGGWQTVKYQWDKITSFLKSQASSRFGFKRVDPATWEKRHISCFGKDLRGRQVSDPCQFATLSEDGKHHYCNACGCGDREMAWLDKEYGEDRFTKLEYPYLECPIGKKGFSNEV